MEFNKIWTKEVNDQYRKMITENKTMTEIKEALGDKMEHHPTKFKYGGCRLIIDKFKDFINEIIYTPLYTDFKTYEKHSAYDYNETDYRYAFKTKSDTVYYLDFQYYRENIGEYSGRNLYNICFTTQELYDKYTTTWKHTDYEEPTNKNEQHEVMKRCIYLVNEFNNRVGRFKDAVYVIGDTVDKRKINFYINLISDAIQNITKKYGESTTNLGKGVWYFEKQK